MCECRKADRKKRLLDKIPVEYRELDLASVRPDANRHSKQTALLDAVKQSPDTSLYLSGKNGCGKTMIGWLLYKRAIEQGRPAIFLPMPELLRQLREWEMDSEKLPAIEAQSLRESKHRWFIGIDEAEKARPSEFASEALFQILDAVYSHHHQLVVTSNFSARDLREHWSRQNPVWGASIMRRIMELDDLIEVEMFNEERAV